MNAEANGKNSETLTVGERRTEQLEGNVNKLKECCVYKRRTEDR
jgi:hypothetical protein